MASGILIFSLSSLHRDPRVLRQIAFLNEKHRITAAGFTDPNVSGVRFIKIGQFEPHGPAGKIRKAVDMLFNRVDSLFWKEKNIQELKARLENDPEKYDLIIANDINILPLAYFFSKRWNIPVLLDMHEYSPREFEESRTWRFKTGRYYQGIAEKYLSKCSHITTVCDGIKRELKKDFNVDADIINNAPSYERNLTPTPVNFGKVQVIHHGGATRSRKIENMIAVAKLLPENFHFNFVLVGDKPYIEELKSLAKDAKNVTFLKEVATTDIASYINKFDVGFYLLEPNNFNNKIALPNKFFEFIQARLCIVIGPSPEMATVVKNSDLGLVAEDFSIDALKNTFLKLSEEKIKYYKSASDKAAFEFSADNNKNAFLKIIESLLGNKSTSKLTVE